MSTKSDIEQQQYSNEDPNKQEYNPTTQNNKSDKGLMRRLFEKFDKKTWKFILYSCWSVLLVLGVASCVVTVRPASQKYYPAWPENGLALWQWSLIITAILGGPILSRGLLHIILLILDNEASRKINAIYYIVELVESGWYVLWFGLILLAWIWVSDKPRYLIFPPSPSPSPSPSNANYNFIAKHDNEDTHKESSIESLITTALISFVVVSVLWLIKDLLIIMMKSSFHIRVFFGRIREVCRHHKSMKALTGGSLCLKPNGNPEYGDKDKDKDKDKDEHGYPECGLCKMTSVLKGVPICGVEKEMEIDKRNLEGVSQEKVSCWDVEVIMKEIRVIKFWYKTYPNGQLHVIDSEKKAIEASAVLFQAILPPGFQPDLSRSRIKLNDVKLLKHMNEKHESQMLHWFENAGFEYIDEEVVQKYMVWAFKYHGALVRGLCDHRALFRDLNRCVNLALVISTVILWLIMSSKQFRDVIFVLGSGIVACAFAFGKFCRTMLDNFAFVFLMHPFDAGDYCLIDGTSVIIEDVNLLTTVALTLDDQQIHFPNAVLVCKNIINYTRSSNMSDSVVFFLHRRTTKEEIKTLKDEIDRYIQEKPRIWDKKHNLVLEYDSSDSQKIKATLNIKHLFNYYDPTERKVRKSDFIEYINDILPNKMDENNDKKTTNRPIVEKNLTVGTFDFNECIDDTMPDKKDEKSDEKTTNPQNAENNSIVGTSAKNQKDSC